MKRHFILPFLFFALAFSLHAGFSLYERGKIAERWALIAQSSPLELYFANGNYLIGASYGLAAGFTAYAVQRYLRNRKKGLTALLGGMTLTGALYVCGCFLLGCCGSPMLVVYLSLFGSSFLGFTKILTFGLTTASIVVGIFLLERRTSAGGACCEGDAECRKA